MQEEQSMVFHAMQEQLLRPILGPVLDHLLVTEVNTDYNIQTDHYLGESVSHHAYGGRRFTVRGQFRDSAMAGMTLIPEVEHLFQCSGANITFEHLAYGATIARFELHLAEGTSPLGRMPTLSTEALPDLVAQVNEGELTDGEAAAAARVLDRVDPTADGFATGQNLDSMALLYGISRERGETDLELHTRIEREVFVSP